MYCFEKYLHGLGSLFSLSTISFLINFNFPIPLIRSFHLCGMALRDTKLQDFQYKLVHRILITNSFLYKCGLKETELCTFCTETCTGDRYIIDAFSIFIAYFRNSRPPSKSGSLHLHLQTYI
jgi:hypothetical protein